MFVIIFLDLSMNTQNIALLQYVLTHEEHDVKVAPHGNSLKEGYVQTMPSVLGSLKSLSSDNTAKRALSFPSSEACGVANAPCAAALPRGRQQVTICDVAFLNLLMMQYIPLC